MDESPRSIETFHDLSYKLDEAERCHGKPSCFNGTVKVRKYRVTVELIDESDEVIAERIRKLWRECDNGHHRMPLKAAAAEYGVELVYEEYGVDRDKKKWERKE